MSTATSIHIGLNGVDPAHYAGWDGQLEAAEGDAAAMEAVARAVNLTPQSLIRSAATRERVLEVFAAAAGTLVAGDLLVITFSGHGARFEIPLGEVSTAEETDGYDEAWCLWNGYLLDDEIHAAIGAFAAGVRVLLVSDSCYSGTIMRRLGAPSDPVVRTFTSPEEGWSDKTRIRAIPTVRAHAAYRSKAEQYDEIRTRMRASPPGPIVADALQFSACQDDEVARETEAQGLFTAGLLATWNGGAFTGDHHAFRTAIASRTPSTQRPNLYWDGDAPPAFAKARPFTR